jgi:sulfopyruvate decarboxylase subunit alpha
LAGPLRADVVAQAVAGLRAASVDLVVSVPDSWMAPLVRAVEADATLATITATNEGEGVSLCAGAWLGGRRAAMVMENSGLRMACEELARLGLEQSIPVLLVMPYRGDLGDEPSWAQSMGITTESLLRTLRIPYVVVRDPEGVEWAIRRAAATMRASLHHAAVLFGIELFSS